MTAIIFISYQNFNYMKDYIYYLSSLFIIYFTLRLCSEILFFLFIHLFEKLFLFIFVRDSTSVKIAKIFYFIQK